MNFQFTEHAPQILHASFSTLYWLTSTFIRFQEFYESPSSLFNGQYFTLESYMDWSASQTDDKFTYFEDWYGFNIPSDVIRKFVKTFPADKLSNKEIALIEKIQPWLDQDKPFYLIGSVVGDTATLNHELAHAYFNLNEAYREEQLSNVANLPGELKDAFTVGLLNHGYVIDVASDEIQAYFSTGMEDNEIVSFDVDLEYQAPFRATFDKFNA